jgi:hypothetical protein
MLVPVKLRRAHHSSLSSPHLPILLPSTAKRNDMTTLCLYVHLCRSVCTYWCKTAFQYYSVTWYVTRFSQQIMLIETRSIIVSFNSTLGMSSFHTRAFTHLVVRFMNEALRLVPIQNWPLQLRGCIQKFSDWPPGARTANAYLLNVKQRMWSKFCC